MLQLKLDIHSLILHFAYGNEKFLGNVLRKRIEEGVISRDKIIITTKLWNTFHRRVEEGCKLSLDNLNLGPIDLFLIHSPLSFQTSDQLFPVNEKGEIIFDHVDIVELWRNMEELVISGRVKNIGVSNFNMAQLQRILNSCRIKPFCNQMEIHLLHQNVKLIEFCKANGIVPEAYSPLSQNPVTKLFTLPKLNEVAKKHNRSMGQIALKFLVQQGITIIPKSTNPLRVKENFNLFDFELTEEEMRSLREEGEANPHTVVNTTEALKKHPEYPF